MFHRLIAQMRRAISIVAGRPALRISAAPRNELDLAQRVRLSGEW